MLKLNMQHFNMYTRKAVRKRTPVKLFRPILLAALVLAAAAIAIGCARNGSVQTQRAQLALEQLLSCTIQQAEDFDVAFFQASAETVTDGGVGLTQDDGRPRDYLAERFGDSMTDACIEDLTKSRAIYRSAALTKSLNSDISAGEVDLTKCSDEQECYNFSAEITSSAGDPAASASGMILMEKDGDDWKADRITLTMDEMQDCGNGEKEESAQDTSDRGEKEESAQEASGSSENKESARETPGSPAQDMPSDGKSTASGPACPSVNGALRVEGTQLVDKNGSPVQLRGISTHGLAWFPDYVNEACFRQLHEEWQANVVRLAMYTAEYGGYCTGGNREALKKLIDDGVSFAERQDMYVVIDWHILSDANPNMYLEDAKAFFDEMAGKYAEQDHVLYEICNEPNGGTSWGEIKSYAEQVIPVIRARDEDAVILVGTPNWSQDVDQAAADPIASYENIMYTLHFYEATHTDDLRGKLAVAVESGLPVFVSEYGICDTGGSGPIDEAQAELWMETLDKSGISYIA